MLRLLFPCFFFLNHDPDNITELRRRKHEIRLAMYQYFSQRILFDEEKHVAREYFHETFEDQLVNAHKECFQSL